MVIFSQFFDCCSNKVAPFFDAPSRVQSRLAVARYVIGYAPNSRKVSPLANSSGPRLAEREKSAPKIFDRSFSLKRHLIAQKSTFIGPQSFDLEADIAYGALMSVVESDDEMQHKESLTPFFCH